MAETQTTESKGKIVALEDGRTAEFAGSRKMQKESFTTNDGQIVVRFDFINGKTKSMRLPDSLLKKFAAHGALQKVGDAAAGEKDVDDMVEAVDSTIKQLEAGEWNVRREAGGFSGVSLVIRAIAEVTGKDIETVKAGIEKKLEALQAGGKPTTRQSLYASFRQNPKVAAVIQRLESEKVKKAAGDLDAEELLAGI